MKKFFINFFALVLLVNFCWSTKADQAPATSNNQDSVRQTVDKKMVLAKSNISYKWEHLSSVDGKLETPNQGNQQTATLVIDVDKNGTNDFIIAERTKAPSVVWYRRTNKGWDRLVVETDSLTIEAGSSSHD